MPVQRHDLPAFAPQRRASLREALRAAEPNNRAASLKKLEDDILAKSTNPGNDARLRTYQAICRAWEVHCFPLDCQNLRCFAASLKAGGYKSSAIYYFLQSVATNSALCAPPFPLWSVRPSRTAFGPSNGVQEDPS